MESRMQSLLIRVIAAFALTVCGSLAAAREVMLMNRIGPSKMTLFVANADGTGERRLLPHSDGLDYDASFSPDGKWIAFTRAAGEFTLYVVPAGGGDATAITAGEDPSWARNSRTIVFTRGRDRARRLSLLDVPTRRVKDVNRISGSCSQPSWAR